MDSAKLLVTQNWILIISALIIAIGWFVTGFLDRKNNIFLKRLEFRNVALTSFMTVLKAYRDCKDDMSSAKKVSQKNMDEFIFGLRRTMDLFYLYCDNDEIEKMERLLSDMDKYTQSPDTASIFMETFWGMVDLSINRTRNDLRLKRINITRLPAGQNSKF